MKNIFKSLISTKKSETHTIHSVFGLKIKTENTLRILQKELYIFIENILNSSLNDLKKSMGLNYKKQNNFKTIKDISLNDEISYNTECPYCKSKKIYSIRDFSIKSMINDYKTQFGFNPYNKNLENERLEKMCCSECNLQFYNIKIPDSSQLYENLLESGNYNYGKFKWDYSIAIENILKYHPKKVLDIGCGCGYFIERINNLVDYTLGTEFNNTALNICSEKKLNVTNNNLNEITEKFDFITLFQLLEHIDTPYEFIKNTINLLEDNGIIVIVTPNPDGFWCSSSNPGVLNLPPHHCLDITKEFLYRLAEDFKLDVLDYVQDTPELNIYKKICNTHFEDLQYLSYLLVKDKLIGHRHAIILRKKVI